MMETLVDLTIKVTLTLAIALAATLLLRRRPAALRHRLWTAAMASALLLPLLALIVPAWRVRIAPSVTLIQPVSPAVPPVQPATNGVTAGRAAGNSIVVAGYQIVTVWAMGFGAVLL